MSGQVTSGEPPDPVVDEVSPVLPPAVLPPAPPVALAPPPEVVDALVVSLEPPAPLPPDPALAPVVVPPGPVPAVAPPAPVVPTPFDVPSPLVEDMVPRVSEPVLPGVHSDSTKSFPQAVRPNTRAVRPSRERGEGAVNERKVMSETMSRES